MDARRTTGLRALTMGTLFFGMMGWAFYWVLPLGMVFSLTGLVLGLVDLLNARRRSVEFSLSMLGLVISAAALAFCIYIAAEGLQTVTVAG
jgi:hypothetical protein